jgi:intein/homing endonuclease
MTEGGIYKRHNKFNNYFMKAYFETEFSANMFEDDIEYLGFYNLDKSKRKIKYYERDLYGQVSNVYTVSHYNMVAILFMAFGVEPGRNKEVDHNQIPYWVMNGSPMVKREFLAGYQGGYGSSIKFNDLNNCVCAETCKRIHLKYKYKDSLKAFFNQMNTLYADLGIETTLLSNNLKYAIKMKDTKANLLKYFDTIGYRYNYSKITESAIVIEYMKINKPKDYRHEIKHQGLSMFIPIKSITEVENCLISDITTESENHSFIAADGFMIHNSAQCKQAIGVYALNYRDRYDTLGHVMHYPQRPIVKTKMASILNTDNMPNGTNAIVAIACYTG